MKNRLKICEIVYSALFALMTVMSRHTTYSDKVESNILTVNVGRFDITDIPVIILVFLIVYSVLQLFKFVIRRVVPIIIRNDNNRNDDSDIHEKGSRGIAGWIVTFVLIMLCYIPYMMSYWPGGIYNDTSYTIDIAMGKSPVSNQNTVLYALFWRLIFALGSVVRQGDYGGLKLMTILQCVALAAVAAGFITWLRGRGVRKWVLILLTAVTAVAPVFPYYGISLWKETWFGLAFFLYTWNLYVMLSHIKRDPDDDNVTEDKDVSAKAKKSKRTQLLISYTVLSFWVIFGRNNGLYVVLFTMVVLSVIMYRAVKGTTFFRTLTAANMIIVALSLIIQGPVYRIAGVEKSARSESCGIPLQQVAYMIADSAVDGVISDVETDSVNVGTDGDGTDDIEAIVRQTLTMTDTQYEVITSIMPISAWITQYNPVVVDSIKFSEYFDSGYFDTHIGDFLGAYAGLVIKNPSLALRGYLISTMGFWDAYKSSSSAYICTQHTAQSEYFMSDYFNVYTDKYLSDIVGPRWYMSGGAIVWIMFGLWVLAGSLSRRRVVYLPGIALWLTYMLATPLSFSFRYVFGLLLCIPLYLCPVLGVKYKDS